MVVKNCFRDLVQDLFAAVKCKDYCIIYLIES